jgi:ABC-type transport system substrate-binding protein
VKGGTLRIIMNSDVTHTMDPQIEYYQLPFAYFRCCLLRTLYNYNGQDAAHDGTKVFPDLADGAPEVSSDGLTYTIHLKQGLKYGDPLGDVSITAPDFIRAIERGYTVGGPYMGYYDIINGATDYRDGKAKTISGMKAVDDNTLQITTTQAVGDLQYRFAMAATAPAANTCFALHKKPAAAVFLLQLLCARNPQLLMPWAFQLPGDSLLPGLSMHALHVSHCRSLIKFVHA